MNQNVMDKLKAAGITFDGARYFITDKNRDLLAQDAAVTPPNAGVPAVFTSYVDTKAIEVLLAPWNATKIFPEVKKGDWTTEYAVFRTLEAVGTVTPYTDFGNGAASDVNVGFPTRQQYVGQTTIKYGDREQAVTSRAMVDLVSAKQQSAAKVIRTAQNKIYLNGIEGMSIYGLINDPNIPAALTPASVDGVTAWSGKTTRQIYDDILSLYKQVITASKGQLDQNSEYVLALSPTASVELGKATDYNVSVQDMILQYAKNTTTVVLPELESATAGDSVMLIATSVAGFPTAELAFGEKMRAMRIVPFSSYYEQKLAFSSYGCVLYYPFAVAKMTGVTAVE